MYMAAKQVNTYFNQLSAEWFAFVYQYNDARASEVISVSYDDLETGVYNYLSAANYTYTGSNLATLVLDKLYQLPDHLQHLMYHTYHAPEMYQQKAGLMDTPRVLYYDGTTGMWRFANNKNLTDGFADFTGVIGNVYPAERRIELVLNGVIYNYSEQPFIPGEVYYLTDLLDGWMVPYQEGGEGRIISVPMAVATGRNSAILLSNRGITKDLPCEKVCPPVSLNWRENQLLYRPTFEPDCDNVVLHLPSNMTGAQTITGDCVTGNSTNDMGNQSVEMNANGSMFVANNILSNTHGGFQVHVYDLGTSSWKQYGATEGGFGKRGNALWVTTNDAGDLVAIGNSKTDLQGNTSDHGSISFYDYDSVNDEWVRRGGYDTPSRNQEPINNRSKDIVGTNTLVRFGVAPKLNAVGNKIISFAQGHYYRDPYAAVYQVDGNQKWTMVGDALDLDSGNAFVDINGDGTVILIGERSWNGTGRIYKWVNNTWTQVGQNIDFQQTIEDNSYQRLASGLILGDTGKGYSLSKDGRTVAFGFPLGNNGCGFVIAYRLNGSFDSTGTWEQLGPITVGDPGEQIGYDVDLSADGNIVVASTVQVDNVYRYKYESSTDSWDLQFQYPSQAGGAYGRTVALSDAGHVLAVGTGWNDGVCVFGEFNNLAGPGDPTVPIIPPKKIFDKSINNFDVTHSTGVVAHNNSYAKYGASSIKFPGTEDGMLTVAPGDKLDFQKQDFCIEFWVLFEDSMRHDFIMGLYDETNRRKSWYIESPGTTSGLGNGMVFTVNNGVESDNILIRLGFDYEFDNNTWFHVALSRRGDKWRWLVNGLEQESRLTDGLLNITIPKFSNPEFRMGAPGQSTHTDNISAVVLDGLKIDSGEVRDASIDDIYPLDLLQDTDYISDTMTCDTYTCSLSLDIDTHMLDVSQATPLLNGEFYGSGSINGLAHTPGTSLVSHNPVDNTYQFKVKHRDSVHAWHYTHYSYSMFNDEIVIDSDAGEICVSYEATWTSNLVVAVSLLIKQNGMMFVNYIGTATNNTFSLQNINMKPENWAQIGGTARPRFDRGDRFSVGITFGQSFGTPSNTIATLRSFNICIGSPDYVKASNTCTVYLTTPVDTVDFVLLRTRDVPPSTTIYINLLDQHDNWIQAVTYEPKTGDPRIMTQTQVLTAAQPVHAIQWALTGTDLQADTQLLQLKSGTRIREWAEFRTARNTRTVPLLGYVDDVRITNGESVYTGNFKSTGKPHPTCA
ncbi:hypothetical protein OAU81_00270 [bacterium]|nr:hypothetical protein [bacterium]